MSRRKQPPGKALRGKTSDRIRSGDIPDEAISNRRIQADDRPDPREIRTASGRQLGKAGRTWPGEDDQE